MSGAPGAAASPEAAEPAAAHPRAPLREGLARGWRAALREFAIIVAGVLCALAAQSWWQAHDERGRERDYLRQLLADTRENERRLDDAIAVDSTAGRAVGRLANTLFGAAPLPGPDTLAALFRGEAFASSDFQPLSGSYGALLMAGDLRLIRTDSLRSLLVSYAATLEHEQTMLGLFLEQSAGQPDRLARPMPFLRGMFFGDAAGPARAPTSGGCAATRRRRPCSSPSRSPTPTASPTSGACATRRAGCAAPWKPSCAAAAGADATPTSIPHTQVSP